MSNVVNIDTKRKGVLEFIEDIIDANELNKDEDFEIVSFVVMDQNFETFSLGGFLGEKSINLFRDSIGRPIEIAKKFVEGKNVGFITETQYNKTDKQMFYKMKDEVDIDLAIEVGLGVVKYNNEYMIYVPFLNEDPTTIGYGMMMLKVYAQLQNPHKIDINLKQNFEENYDLIMVHMLGASPANIRHISRLEEIFA